MSKFILKAIVEFDGTISEFKEMCKLKKSNDFTIEWYSNYEFDVVSKLSFGVVSNYMFSGISLNARIIESSDQKIIISLSTFPRFELFIIGLFSIFFFFYYILSEEYMPFWVLLIMPIALLWFWYIYRSQEKGLLKDFKKYLKK